MPVALVLEAGDVDEAFRALNLNNQHRKKVVSD